jgi:hypothetical protein
VSVERTPGATDTDVGCIAEEAVAAASSLLNGRLVLRGAAVAIGDRAIVLCGHSAAGKSALAAGLALRGHCFLADAVVSISLEGSSDRPVVWPLAPQPVLWPDSAEELGLTGSASREVRPGLAKRAYDLGGTIPSSPVSLAALVVLRPEPTRREPALEPISGALKLRTALAARWYQRLVSPLGLAGAHFDLAVRVADAAVCSDLMRPARGTTIATLAQLVEEAVT